MNIPSIKGLTKSVITFDTALYAVLKAENTPPVSYNFVRKNNTLFTDV